MSLKDSIAADMKSAMRDQEKVRLETIRLLRSAIQRKEVDERIELDDKGILLIIQKLVKQCSDAATQFVQGNRQDLADKERQNIAILKAYLPEPLSIAEIESLIKQAIDDSGASSMKDMGKIMGIVKDRAQGRADMGLISGKIKSILS